MRLADGKENSSVKQRAVMYRNGLFIAILAARPYMRRNKHHLIIKMAINWSGRGQFICFGSQAMK